MLNADNPTPDLWALQGRARGIQRDHGEGPRGTGLTVNVLIPGGAINTPMISDEAGFDGAKLIQPEVIALPLVWLVSDTARRVTGRRFLAVHWDTRLLPDQFIGEIQRSGRTAAYQCKSRGQQAGCWRATRFAQTKRVGRNLQIVTF